MQDDANDILANIMHVALNGRHDDLAFALGTCDLFGLNIGEEMRDGFLHNTRGFDDLRKEHFAAAKQVADDIHAIH